MKILKEVGVRGTGIAEIGIETRGNFVLSFRLMTVIRYVLMVLLFERTMYLTRYLTLLTTAITNL